MTAPQDKQRRIRSRGKKTNRSDVCDKMGIPCTWSLLQPIHRFVKKTDNIRFGGIDKAGRLLTENYFIENVTKKSVLSVQLMNRPLARSYKVENNANCGRFDRRTEGLIKVHTRLL